MKRGIFLGMMIFMLGMMVSGVLANPRSQADYAVLTVDNIPDVTLIAELPHEGIRDIYVSSDGRVASVGYDSVARIWDIDPQSDTFGEEMQSVTLEAPVCGDKCYPTSVALEDNFLVVGSIHGITWFINATTGLHLWAHEFHSGLWVNDIVFSADHSVVFTTGDNGVVGASFLDSYVGEFVSLGNTEMHNVAVSADGQYIAYAGGDFLVERPDTVIRLTDLNMDDVVNSPEYGLEGHERPVLALEFSPDSTLLASGGGDEFTEHPSIRLWDVETGENLATLTLTTDYDAGIAYPEAIAFSPDGSLMVVGAAFGQLLIFETDDFRGDLTLDDIDHIGLPISLGELAFTSDGKFLVNLSVNGTIQVWGVEE